MISVKLVLAFSACISLLPLSGSAISAEEPASDPFDAFLSRHRTEMRVVLMRGGPSWSESEKAMNALLAAGDLSALPEAQRKKMLAILIAASKNNNVPFGYTGFVEEPLIVELALVGLESSAPDIRSRCLELLQSDVRDDDLAEIRDRAVSLARAKPEMQLSMIRLLSRWPRDVVGKLAEIPGDDALPDGVLARWGDEAAQARLLDALAAAKDIRSLRAASMALGNWGGEAAEKALVIRLSQPPLIASSRRGQFSGHTAILKALGRIHQREPLFTRDILCIVNQGEEYFTRLRSMEQYAVRINNWCEARHGVSPITDPSAFWLIKKTTAPIE